MTTPTNQTDSEGRQHGVWMSYHENGVLWWKLRFLHDKLHKLSETYRSDGTPYFKRYYLTIK